MTVFVIRRLHAERVLVLFVMSLIVFFGVYAIGDPVDILIAADADQAEREARHRARWGSTGRCGSNTSLFVAAALQGDLGRSFVFGEPALTLIVQRMPATLELALAALVMAVVARHSARPVRGSASRDIAGAKLIMAGSILGFSLPTFWVGLMLIMVFAVDARLAAVDRAGRDRHVSRHRRRACSRSTGCAHLAPAGVQPGAVQDVAGDPADARRRARDAAAWTTSSSPAPRACRTRRIVGVHVLKNILIPIVTVLGLEFGTLIAFAVVTETIFAWPGMGKLIIDSINTLDRPVIVAYLMVIVLHVRRHQSRRRPALLGARSARPAGRRS